MSLPASGFAYIVSKRQWLLNLTIWHDTSCTALDWDWHDMTEQVVSNKLDMRKQLVLHWHGSGDLTWQNKLYCIGPGLTWHDRIDCIELDWTWDKHDMTWHDKLYWSDWMTWKNKRYFGFIPTWHDKINSTPFVSD